MPIALQGAGCQHRILNILMSSLERLSSAASEPLVSAVITGTAMLMYTTALLDMAAVLAEDFDFDSCA